MRVLLKTTTYIFGIILILTFPLPLLCKNKTAIEGKSLPVCTTEQAKAYMTEIIPLVEKAADRKFIYHPSIQTTSQAEVVKVLTKELTPQFRNLQPKASASDIWQQAEKTALLYSKCMLGKYGTDTRMLYIIPDNIKPCLESAKVDMSYRKAILKLTIAHELTHALQDQYIELGKAMLKSRNAEQLSAFSCTIEGHATFIQDKVADSLNLRSAENEFTRAINATAENLDPAMALASRTQARVISDLYICGRDFIAWNYSKGGSDRVWNILTAPPVKTSMILHPETYSPVSSHKIDFEAILNGTEKKMGVGKWMVQNSEVGEIQFRALYADMDPLLLNNVLVNMEHAQAYVATNTNKIASVSVFVFKDTSVIPKLINTLSDICQRNITKLETDPSIKIKNFKSDHFNSIKSDVNTRIKFDINGQGINLHNNFTRIGRGKVMLEFFYQSADIPDARTAQIAESIFSKLPPELTTPVNNGSM